MSRAHGKPRGRCDICRMDALEAFFGVQADHVDDPDDEDGER